MICSNCGKPFLRSKSRMNDHSLCKLCKFEETYKNKRKSGEIENITKKRKETCLDKYGVDNIAQSKKYNDKACSTKLDKYGYVGHFQSPNIQNKLQELAHNKESYAKREETCMKKYGEAHHMKNEEIKKKGFKTYKENTGYENPMNNPEVIQKIIDTYGRVGQVKGYFYNNIHFDSSWELSFYIWLMDNKKQFIYHPNFTFEYMGDDNKLHIYIPDFLVEGKFYEIKGTQFFNESGEPYNMYTKKFWWGKYHSIQKNNVIILKKEDMTLYLKYVSDTYGSDYLRQFKVQNIIKLGE